MKKTNKNILIYLLGIILLTGFATAECTTSTGTNSTDYIGINQSADNTITMGTNQIWAGFTFFTPRLNFTHTVYETIVGVNTTKNTTLLWKMIAASDNFTNINTTFVLKNGTTTIDPTNYTLVSNDNRTYYVVFNVPNYNGYSLGASFNRTFVKNVDDIYTNYTSMQPLYTFSQFITTNSPTEYGDNLLFRVNPSSQAGNSINISNWAVGWSTTDVTCGAECDNPINTTLLDVIITMFMIGMLVFIAFQIKGGGVEAKGVIALAVGWLVLLIALLIIRGVLSGMCAV